jgi:hypothetical protein
MADKPKSGLLQRLGSGFDRYIGGLLGEDLESMTPEERANARRQAIGAMGRSMMDPASSAEQYGAVTQARAQQRARGELARRAAAAEAAMPDLASRIFGGTGGRSIEALPGVGGEAMPMTARRVPSREGAREALSMLYGTQAGQDVATMAPGLVEIATEGVTGRTVGGSVYNPLTGRFDAPRTARSTTLTPAEVRQLGAPPGTIIQRDSSGKLSVLPVPRAVGGGGGGGAPMGAGGVPGAAPAPGAGRLGNLLTAEELRAAGLPEGTVAQFDPRSGKVNVISSVPSTQRVSTEGKERAVRRIEASSELLQKQLDRVSTGGFLGITGAVGRVFDSQDARQFETFKEQLSSGLRSALRIPGEGALSDREQAQYGLTLPSLGMSKERNIEIMRALEDQVRLAADLPTLGDEKPEGLSASDWLMMLPSERAEFKRAGVK